MPSGVGPRALIVAPNGSAALVTLPAEAAAMAAAIHEAVGGYFGCPVGGGDWVAYVNADPGPAEFANPLADVIACQLGGWHAPPGPLLVGVVVFVGRSGAQEVDVPERLLTLADPGARPAPRRAGNGLRFRVYVDGEVADETWLGRPETGPVGAQLDGAALAIRHRELCEQAEAAGQTWQIEVFDPDEPDGEQYYRFGTDAAGMVLPMAYIPGPPGHPAQSAN